MRLRRTEVAVLLVLLFIIAMICGLAVFGGRIYERFNQWTSTRYYEANPPAENVFVPDYAGWADDETESIWEAPAQFESDVETVIDEEMLPAQVLLEGVTYTDQHGKWNYCAPANLTMALSFWGVNLSREEVGEGLKPFGDDKNVNPEEMVVYVESHTSLRAVKRVGGSVYQIKKLLANGYPVLIEKGEIIRDVSTGVLHWAGHYVLVLGYDDAKEVFITRDSYYSPPDYALDFEVSYTDMKAEWQNFNYVFVVLFPAYEQEQVIDVLGQYADETWAVRQAYQQAHGEMHDGQDLTRYFALFNLGDNLLAMGDAVSASSAFDEAFQVYGELETDHRPWRMMWYRNSPYQAYYEAGRYQDVINLALNTIESTSQPYFEESWYWRGMAYLALGEREKARQDFEKALVYNENYQPAQQALNGLE